MSAAVRQEREPRKILVLGATSGIAEACVRLWAARGDALFLVARNEGRLTAVAADASVRGASYVGVAAADLNDTSAHAALLAHAADALGGLDVAFLAFGVLGDANDHSFAAAAPVLHTNLIAAASAVLWLAD